MRLSAVIGASYGDEGKGHTVDALVDSNTLVVRFNGGAQAGHTVQVGNRRHVHHHFGSGTFRGASTFLSRFFIVNPLLFCQELREIPTPRVYVDPRCLVTTPWDIMLNQAVEAKRSGARHGSCGVGINETVTRDEAGFELRFEDIRDERGLRNKLYPILDEWLPRRLQELEVTSASIPWARNQGVLIRFIEDCLSTSGFCMPDSRIGRRCFGHVMFEGAQGLRLDEFGEDFPHVTRSRTGLTNVLKLLDESNLDGDLDVYYVTRPYLTRHGAGPLAHELPEAPYPGIDDPTNRYNEHQGTIRYAWLDVDELARNIIRDLGGRAIHRKGVLSHIVVTCVDQMPTQFNIVADGSVQTVDREKLVQLLKAKTLGEVLLTDGPGERLKKA